MEANSVPHTPHLPVLLRNLVPEHQHNHLPSSQIPRPSSCPPVLSGWKPHDARQVFPHSSELLEAGLWRILV
jgi:hypothetical protein